MMVPLDLIWCHGCQLRRLIAGPYESPVCLNAPPVLQVTSLGSVLHLIGGTCASFMIFLLPGLLCWCETNQPIRSALVLLDLACLGLVCFTACLLLVKAAHKQHCLYAACVLQSCATRATHAPC